MALREWIQKPFDLMSAYINPGSPTQPPEKPPLSYRGGNLSRKQSLGDQVRELRRLDPQASVLFDRGLRNKPGENNCFLNAAVQVLWHNDVFRKSFRKLEGHTHDGEVCIFCALKVLFTQFEHSEHGVLPPDVLRVSMAKCYEDQHRFQLGLMDDAAECFEKLLEHVHYHLTGTTDMEQCQANYCISHAKFALTIVEQTRCGCGFTSEPLIFVQFIHYVSAMAIANERERVKDKIQLQDPMLFDHCLRTATAMGETRLCQNYPKCENFVQFRRFLLNDPDAVCIGLIWDSASPSIEHIMNVIETIGLRLHPSQVFDQVLSEKMKNTEYHLNAMITYYGRHYSTFCFHSHKREWYYFDDAKFRKVSADWSCVVDECRRAHFQPLLLVYTNPHGQAVDTTDAPKDVVPTLETKLQSHSQSHETTPTPTSQPNADQGDMPEPKSQSDRPESGRGQQSTSGSQPAINLSSVSSASDTQEKDLITFSLSPVVLANSQTHGSGLAVAQDKTPFLSSYQTVSRPDNTSTSGQVTASDSHCSPGPARWGQSTVAANQTRENRDILEPVLHSTIVMTKNSKEIDLPMPSHANSLGQCSSQPKSLSYHVRATSPSFVPKRATAGSPSLYPNLHHAQATTGHSSYTQPMTYPQSRTHGSADPYMPVGSDSCPKELHSNNSYFTGAGPELAKPSTVAVSDSTPQTKRSVDESSIHTKTLEEIDVSAKVKETIQDVELCLCKARTYQEHDGVVSSLLFNHAADQLQQLLRDAQVQKDRILSLHIEGKRDKALLMAQQLEVHLVLARNKLPAKSMQLRCSSAEPPSVHTTSTVAAFHPSSQKGQICISCQNKREIDEFGLCGPCHLRQTMKGNSAK